MNAPAVPVCDDQLLRTCVRILRPLRDMADGGGSEAEREGARLALWCTERVIKDIAGQLS